MSLIEVNKVSKKFGPVTAVVDVAFEIQANRICGLVGSDGAGKTTLLRMIATMVPPTSGHILVDGLDVVSQRASVKEVCGYMPQRFGLYQDLTVAENLDFFMDIYSITGDERSRRREYYLGFSNLLPFLDRKAGDLSGGMKQKLGLACVLVHQPKVLILDEPTDGLDPNQKHEVRSLIREMSSDKIIVISTHILEEVEALL